MTQKQDRLVVFLEGEDKAWAEREARRLGLKPWDVVRMAVRTAQGDGLRVVTDHSQRKIAEEAERARREKEAKRQALLAQLAELEDAGDRAFAPEQEPDPDDVSDFEDQLFLGEETVPPPPVRRHGPPGTMTIPAGVSTNVTRGYDKTDPQGSVARQNFAHLGFDGGGGGRRNV